MAAPAGRSIWLKLESVQPTGSFKIRGIGHLCEHEVAGGAERLVASSGGNAGVAVAYAGARLGVPVTVVVPSTTAERMRNLIARHGAEVIVHGDVWDEAHARAEELAAASNASVIPPFDHPVIWDGHASIIEEAADEIAEPDWVVVAVGGGGLLGGVLVGLERVGWSRTQVLAVETDGASSFHRSLQAGELVELDAITSVAKSLGARRVSAEVLERALARGVKSAVVSDRAATGAVVRFADDCRQLVEPACGAALAAAYDWQQEAAESILVLVCGGAAVTAQDLESWRGR